MFGKILAENLDNLRNMHFMAFGGGHPKASEFPKLVEKSTNTWNF